MNRKCASSFVLALSAFTIAGLAAAARADTLYVPGDYETIQAAVNASHPDDMIMVNAGTYAESVVISGITHHGLTIYGTGVVVIEGQGTAPALTVKSTWNVSIHTLTLRGGGTGLLVQKAKDVSADGLTVENVAGDGVVVDRSQDVELASNTIDNAGGDAIQLTGSYYVTLADNDLLGAAESGVTIEDTDAVTLVENVVAGSAGDGVTIEGSEDVSVCGNNITDCGENGVECDDSALVVLDENTIDETAEDAVNVDGTDSVGVFNNDIGTGSALPTIAGDGVHIENSSSIDMQLNTVIATQGSGVSVSGAGATIETNYVSDTGGAAIEVTDDTSYAYVSGNTVSRAAGSGIVIDATSSTVVDNRIEHAGFDGIQVEGGNNSVGSNTIDRPANDGMCILNTPADMPVVLENNTVVRPGDDGVDLGATSQSEITGNAVTRARDNGFELSTGGGNLFDANHANRSRGFDLFEAAEPEANQVSATNKFKSMNRRARHGKHRK